MAFLEVSLLLVGKRRGESELVTFQFHSKPPFPLFSSLPDSHAEVCGWLMTEMRKGRVATLPQRTMNKAHFIKLNFYRLIFIWEMVILVHKFAAAHLIVVMNYDVFMNTSIVYKFVAICQFASGIQQ